MHCQLLAGRFFEKGREKEGGRGGDGTEEWMGQRGRESKRNR